MCVWAAQLGNVYLGGRIGNVYLLMGVGIRSCLFWEANWKYLFWGAQLGNVYLGGRGANQVMSSWAAQLVMSIVGGRQLGNVYLGSPIG